MRDSFLAGVVLLGIGIGLAPVPGARAAVTIYVGPTRAYTTIQAGINAAGDGDTVIVDANTVAYPAYINSGNRDIDFDDKAITVRSAAGPATCIIDVQDSSGHRGFLFNGDETASSVLSGFTIMRGNITGTSDGGAIKCTNGSAPTIEDCIITDNHAGGKGGGIYCDGSSPTITGCEISYNYAGGSGDGGGCGGGVALYSGSSPTLTDCQIFGNESDRNGGGVWMNAACSPAFEDCTIESNVTLMSSADGGGVSVDGSGSTPEFTRCLINGNEGVYGGGIYVYAAHVKLVNCVLNSNLSRAAGGAALLYYGTGADMELWNCTVYDNHANSFGGAFYVNGGADMTLKIRNCIVWGNRHIGYGQSYSANQIQTFQQTTDITVNYTCIEGVWSGTGNRSDNPLLATDGYHIASNSPCIDKGNDADVLSDYDIDGEDRIHAVKVDMGADEDQN